MTDSADRKRAQNRARYAAKREQIKAQVAAYRAANAEKVKAMNAAYYVNNRGQRTAYAAEYRAQHRPEARALAKQWREQNPERAKAVIAAWYAANPDAMRIKKQNRRARKAAVGGSLSRGLVGRLLTLQRGRCASCACDLKSTGHHLDHIVPLAKRGPHEDGNMQLLCPPCNMAKSDKDPLSWAAERGLLL